MFFILLFNLLNSKIDNSSDSFSFLTHYNKTVQLYKHAKYFHNNKSTKLSRRTSKVNDQNGWYYIHFYSQNISTAFQLLQIDRKNEIMKNTYTLFLTKKQLNQISDISFIKIINPNEKIHEENNLINETNLFIVTTLPHYLLPQSKSYNIEMKYGFNTYLIRIDEDIFKKKKIINELSHIPEIKSVTTYKKPSPKNSIGTGFTQRNNFNFTYKGENILTSNRYLNDNGLNGEGQIITVMDTPLDFYHSMFYDDEVSFELNRYMPNHRKIIYYGYPGNLKDLENSINQNEHGTHVCGTLAGKSMCKNDTFGLANFKGNAPEAKILFAGYFDDVEPDILGELMKNCSSKISSNSWGSTGYDTFSNYVYGNVAYDNPQDVFIYAAGNEYELLNGNFSVCDPAGSKNVLTVGAIDDFYNEDQRFFLMKSLNVPDFNITFNDTMLSNNDVWFSGNFETQKISIVDMSKGDQCNDIINNDITLLYGNYSDWIKNCIFYYGKQCLYTKEEEKVKELFNNIKGKIYFQRVFDINKKVIKRAPYSSTGPANNGILKPDIMAPGTKIISAKSNKKSNHTHGCLNEYSDDYVLMDGTSMAAPNIAGGMALVHQFFNSGRWIEKVNLSGITSRALLINSCQHPLDSKTPDILYGHGVVDLSTILPINNEFGVQLTNQNHHNSVPENGHVIATLKVNPMLSKNKLQITLSYLDPLLDIESCIPITRDLDLIVVSPSKKVFIGDHLDSKDTQHVSTNEKVIINENEVEEGDYLIHVYGGSFADSFGSNKEKQEFAVVVSGPVENGYLEFIDSNQCPCDKCDENQPGFCRCDANKNIGQVCQINIDMVKVNKSSFIVGPLEIKRIRFIQNDDKVITKIKSSSERPGRGATIWVSKKCHLSLGEYEINGQTGFEFEEDDTFIDVNFDSNEICLAIFNNNDLFSTYDIEVFTENKNKNNKDADNTDLILMICIAITAVVLAVLIIIIIILCIKLRMYKCCQKDENYERSLLHSDLAISTNE